MTSISSRVLNGAPMSAQEVSALRARRRVLSDQLESADGRRKELSQLARNATGADKAGLEQRIGVLDARLARLETDIDETGRLLSSAPAALVSSRGSPDFTMDRAIPIVGMLSVFVLFPIAMSIARNIWRRGSLPRSATPDRESAQRLERMEQAMEAIAIEIERVSEGQRFVTRLLGEQRVGVPVGQGERAVARSAELSHLPASERNPS
ncbi:MAG: hypothetical protein LH467_08410 [Gemmatimonadaceae bacterium]|nr:hypothetical protein [Gemmatimonadaceae bacterium]